MNAFDYEGFEHNGEQILIGNAHSPAVSMFRSRCLRSDGISRGLMAEYMSYNLSGVRQSSEEYTGATVGRDMHIDVASDGDNNWIHT